MCNNLKPNTMMHAVKLIYKCNIHGPFNVQKKMNYTCDILIVLQIQSLTNGRGRRKSLKATNNNRNPNRRTSLDDVFVPGPAI